MEEDISPLNQQPDRNEAAFYAQQYLEAGKRLDLGPSLEQQADGSFALAKLDEAEEAATFYEQNPHLGIDLDAPDAESNWIAVRTALQKRHTDYLDMFATAAQEVAKIPFGLAEGLIENGIGPKGIAKSLYSTAEGTARGLRDMWGIATESENPNSIFFGLRSVINAVMHGKLSSDWRDEAQQWNEARKFLYHSHLMSQGDETLLEQFSSLDLSEETKNNLRGMVNPKIAHAMAFLGMELPSLLTAPFTGGASQAGAVMAGASNVRVAANASRIKQIGSAMAAATKRFEDMAGRFSEVIAGNTAYGIGKVLQPIATTSEAVFGGTIEAVSKRSGFAARELENAAVVTAINAGEAVAGTAATRQTVGFVGSLGIRTASELAQELGDTILQRANGVIPISEINGLTVLERLATSKNLSPSARYVAKAANVIVDPFIQMSTAGLKNSYKDALIFGGLGYMNDEGRGAVGGAATGMVWGGYSGAFRHTWANINGGFHHANVIENFDRNFTSIVEQKSPEFANFTRKILTDVDALKSSRISANTRFALQTAWLALSEADKTRIVLHKGDAKSYNELLVSKGITHAVPEGTTTKGSFSFHTDAHGEVRPVLWLNENAYRATEVGHEIMSHLAAYTLEVKGKDGDFIRQLIGTEKDGGIYGDDKMLLEGAVRRMVTEWAVESQGYLSGIAASEGKGLNEIANREARKEFDRIYSMAESWLDLIRSEGKVEGPEYWLNKKWAKKSPTTGEFEPSAVFVQRYLFEENIAKHSEALFIHTNLFDIPFEGKTKPIRLMMERFRNELFSKQVTHLELAGIRAKHGEFFTKDGTPTIQVEVYDGGKYHRHEAAEGLVRALVNEARGSDSLPVNKLSPERQAMEARRYGKEHLFKFTGAGATMLGTKELNEKFSENAKKGISVLESLPDSVRPEIIVDEHGNKSVDMYEMKNEAYDALIASGVLDAHSAEVAKGMRDMMKRWEASGFAESNLMAAFYWGDSHRIQKDGFFQRLFGKDVPVTYRVFVPFELKLSLRTTDSNGKPLRAAKGGMTATVLDYMAIHRRKIRMWEKAYVNRLFTSDRHYHSLFDKYLVNMMADPSTRVPSAELFRKEFGAKAEEVRDIMYETFGGRKRADESYINTPREGYASNPENPDYPIHSMKLELIVGAERLAVAPMPYHHGRSYEGLRRNYSVGGFAVYGGNVNRLRNAQGYEISTSNDKFKLFNPFGVMVGIFDSAKKAIRAANKDLKKLDDADIMPNPVALEDAKIPSQPNASGEQMRSAAYTATIRDGVRLSTGVMGRDKVVRYFDNELSDNVFDVLRSSHDTMWKDENGFFIRFSKASDTRRWQKGNFLTIADISKNGGSKMDDVMRRSGFTWGSRDIAILPSADRSSLGVKDAYVQRIHVEKDGVYSYWEMNNQTGMPTVFIDTEGLLRDHPDPKVRHNLTKAIIEHEVETIIRQMGRESEVTGGHSIHPSFVSDAVHEVQKAQLEYLTKALSRDKSEWAAEETAAVQKIQSDFASILAPFSNMIDADGELLAGGLLDPAKIKTIKDLKAALGSKIRLNAAFPRTLESLPAKDALRLISILTRGISEASKTQDFSFVAVDRTIKAIPMMTGQKIGVVFNEFESFVRTVLTGPNRELNEGYIRLGNEISHAYMQLNKHAGLEDMAAKGDTSVVMANVRPSASFRYVVSPLIIKQNLGFSRKEVVKNRPVVSKNATANLYLTNGAIYSIAEGANVVGGFTGGEGDVGLGSMNFKNEGSELTSGHLPFSTIDGATFHEAMGWLMPDSDRARGKHVDSLLIVAMSEMPNRQNEIIDQYNAAKQSGDFGAFTDYVLGVAAEDNMHSSMVGAMVVKTMVGVDSGAYNFRSPEYARKWSSSQFTNWLSRYWALPVEGEAVGIKKSEPVAVRMLKAKGTQTAETMASFHRSLAMLSTAHKWADSEMYPHWAKDNSRLSVGALSVLKDEAKDEMRAKGLVSTIRFGGSTIDVFEFSDAGASLNLAKAANRPHILPFLSNVDPESAYADYAAAVRRRATLPADQRFIGPDVILGEARLGDVFTHSELYNYYPEFRDMKVVFKDFHGGRHVYQNGVSTIELGVRSFAASELNLPAELQGNIFNSGEGLRSTWIARNPLASIILHEVQHAIQLKHGWIADNVTFGNIPNAIAAHAFGNLLGMKISLAKVEELRASVKDPDVMMDGGRFVELSGATRAAKSDAELLNNLVIASSSPVIRNFRTNAKPLIISATRNLTEFILSEHANGRATDAIAKQAMGMHEAAKRALDVDDAIDVYQQFVQLRKHAITNMPEYAFQMHDNMQFRTAYHALGLVSSFDLMNYAMPEQASVMLMQAMGHYKDLAYIMEPVERMARETERRRGMSEQELAANPRTFTDDSVQDPILKAIRGSLDASPLGSERDFARTISENGIANVILKSVGGLGEVDATDSRILTTLGKAVLMQAIAHSAHDTLEILKRVVLETKGWEVDKEGRLRLTTGFHVLSGISGKEAQKRLTETFGKEKVNTESGEGTTVISQEAMATEGYTYSVEDIATLIGATVESSNAFSVGNSAMDAVLSPIFPAHFKGSEIMGYMEKSGIATPEGMAIAKVEKIAKAYEDIQLTKNDLLNLMAVAHGRFTMISQLASETRGDVATRRGISQSVLSNLSREQKALLIRENAAAREIFENVNKTESTFGAEGHKYMLGAYTVNGNRVVFNRNVMPQWVTELDGELQQKWAQMTQRVADHIMSKNRLGFVGPFEDAANTALAMNKAYAAKVAMFAPYIDAAFDRIIKSEADISLEQKTNMALLLMDEIERASIIMAAHEFVAEDPSQIRSGKNVFTRGGETSISTELMERTLNRGGAGKLPKVALGVSVQYNPLVGGNSTAMSIVPQFSAIHPSSVSLSDSIGHATSTLWLTESSSGVGISTESFSPAVAEGTSAKYDMLVRKEMASLSGRNRSASNNHSAMVMESLMHYADRHEVELTNEIESLQRIVDGESNFFGNESLDQDSAASLLAERKNKLLSVGRDKLLASKFAESNLFSDAFGLTAASENLSRAAYAPREHVGEVGYGVPKIALDNVQGRVIGDSLVIDVEAVSPTTDAPTEFASAGITMSLVPARVRKNYVAGKTHLELGTLISLFGSHNTRNGIKGPAELLAPVGDLAVELAREESFGGVSSMTNISDTSYAHVVGGNALLTIGNIVFAGLSEDPENSVVNYIGRNSEAIQRVYADPNGPFSIALTTKNKGLGVPSVGGQLQLSNRSIGLAASFPMAVFLKSGYLDFWGSDNVLALDVPDAFKGTSYEFLASAEGTAEFAARVLTPDAEKALDSFMSQLDTHAVDMIVNELSTIHNARAISDMLAFINVHELIRADDQTPISKLGNRPLRETINYALSNNTQHTVHLHAALKNDTLGFTPSMTKAHMAMLREAIGSRDFWIGVFSQREATNFMEIWFPRSAANDGMFFSRTGADGQRVATHYFTPDSYQPRRTSPAAGHSYENLSSTGHVVGPQTMGSKTQKMRHDDPILGTTYNYYAQRNTQGVSSTYSDHSGPSGGVFTIPQYTDWEKSRGEVQEYFQNTSMHMGYFQPDVYSAQFGRAPVEGRRYIQEGIGDAQVFYDKSGVAEKSQIRALSRTRALSSGSRRTLAVNQIVAMAKQMGVDKVAIQPARFTASSRVNPYVTGLPTATRAAEAVTGDMLVRHAFKFGIPFGSRLSADTRPSTGFSWNRLEDGRILVNFSPDTNIYANYDRGLVEVAEKNEAGLNLYRSLGYNPLANGIIAPQDPRTFGNMVTKAGALARSYKTRESTSIVNYVLQLLKSGLPIVSREGVVDTPLLRHYDKALAASLKGGALHGPKMADFLANNNVAGGIRSVQVVIGNTIKRLMEGTENTFGQLKEGESNAAFEGHLDGIGLLTNGNSPDLGYVSFVLPKDANLETFQRHILKYYLSQNLSLIGNGMDMMDTYISGVTRNPYSGSINTWAYGGQFHPEMLRDSSFASKESPAAQPIRDYNINEPAVGGAGKALGTAYAASLRDMSNADPLFISGIEKAFEMMMSSERGYHVPLAEQNLRKSGDRVEVIRAMFPNRPELEQFAWDNPSGMNLSIVSPSRGAAKVWRVGYDKVVGYDSVGVPVRQRVVQPFNTESAAKSYADSIAKSGILAEHVRMLNLESEANIETLPSQPNVRAMPHMLVMFNPESIDGPGSVLTTTKDKYAVGHFMKAFPTIAEAKAFGNMVMKSEAVTGKVPERIDVRLSAGSLADMERDLRSRIGFSTMGSPLQFASVAMNAIVRGSDKNKRFKDKATGLEWYEMLTFNGTNKQEMRVTGLAQFLYDHRTINISRQEVAEYIYAMYPIMGRRRITERNGSAGVTRIPSSGAPVAIADSHGYLYHKMHKDQLERLDAIAAQADEAGKTQLAQFSDILKDMHVKAFKSVLSSYMPADKVDTLVPSYSHLQSVIQMNEAGLRDIGGPVLELYREAYNDMVRSMSQEQLNLASGFDALLPDPRGHYDQKNLRPLYLRPIEGERDAQLTTKSGTQNFHYVTGGRDWAEYSSSASGPYQVDVLYGMVPVERATFEKYIATLEERKSATADEAERARYDSMMASAQRTFEVRKAASEKARASGHWNTGERTMQYTHLRHASVISLAESLPNPDAAEMVDSVNATSYKGEQGAAQPLTLIEELQSDPYQRATFGPSKESRLLMASDFKQAESFSLFPELEALNRELAAFDVTSETKIKPAKWNYDWPRQNMGRMLSLNIVANSFYERLTLAEKNLLIHSAKGMDAFQELPLGKVVRVLPKELADKMGIPQEVREINLSKEQRESLMYHLQESVLGGQYENENGQPLSMDLFRKLFPQVSGIIPNLDGKATFEAFARPFNRNHRGLVGQIYGMLSYMALADETIHANAEKIALSVRKGVPHEIDFDAMAYQYVGKIQNGMSQNLAYLSPRERAYARTLTADMSVLLESSDYSVTHLYLKNSEGNKWMAVEHGTPEWVTSKHVFYVPKRVSTPSGTVEFGKADRYMALTPVEAIRMDLNMARHAHRANDSGVKIPERYYAAFKEAQNGERPHNWLTFLGALEYEPAILTDEFIAREANRNNYEMSALQTVDNDMDSSSRDINVSRYVAFPHRAKTPLGKMLEVASFYPAESIYQFAGDSKVNELRAKRDAVAAKMKLPTGDEQFNYPDTIPLGEDNAYRELAVKYYVMRALQAGHRGLVVADARHHRLRYHSLDSVKGAATLGKGMVFPMQQLPLGAAYALSKAAKSGAHGNFIGRMAAEGIGSFTNEQGIISHNGVEAGIRQHLDILFREAMADMPSLESEGRDLPAMFAKQVYETNATVIVNGSADTVMFGKLPQYIREGKITPKNLTDTQSLFQSQFGGDVGLDVFKRLAKMVENPMYMVHNIPYEKTHGYAVNYGAPHWNNMVYYAGLSEDFIAKQSHDIFARPVVEMKDGKYNILDAKTGKLLIGGIESPAEMRERVAQLSKYLGSVPIVSVFLKQFGKVGGHALESHLWEGSSAHTLGSKMNEDIIRALERKNPQIPLDEYRAKMNRTTPSVSAGPQSPFGMNTILSESDASPSEVTAGSVRSFNQMRKAAEGWKSSLNNSADQMMFMLHAMGVTKDSDQSHLAAAVNRVVGFNGPSLIIKPKFQTEAHRMEMMKLIRSGVSLMSVGDLHDPVERTRAAVDAFKFYADMYPIQSTREDEVER